jgi:hypothetical protein
MYSGDAVTRSTRRTAIPPTPDPFLGALGGPEGLESSVVDTPIYDRALMRALKRWTGLSESQVIVEEWDDGNGIWYTYRRVV